MTTVRRSLRRALLLSTAHRRCQRVLNVALRELDLEERHFATLAVLERAGPLTQRQLVDLLDLDKSSLGRIVDELERRELVERRAVPGDRRAHAVHLTDRGRDRVADAQGIVGQVGRQLFGHLSVPMRQALDDALQLILRGP